MQQNQLQEDEPSTEIENVPEEPCEPMDTSTLNEEEDQKKLQACNDLLASTAIDFSSTTSKLLQEQPKKPKLQEEWSTDSDSNSTAPEPEDKLEANSMDDVKEEIPEKPPETAPPVKLIISKKKGSIFKSRSMVPDGGKKRHALYKHKWCDDKDQSQKTSENSDPTKTPSSSYDFGFKDEPLIKVSTSLDNEDDDQQAITGVKCARTDKGVSGIFHY